MNGVIYGIEITGDGSVTITVTVLWLWWMVVTLLAGLFMTYSTVRDWLAGVIERVRQDDKRDAQRAPESEKWA